MQITVTRNATGDQILRRLESEYGSLPALEEAAKRQGAHQAQEDWLTAQDLLPSARRRGAAWTQSETYRLEASDLGLLTPQRLRILEALQGQEAFDGNVRALAARLGRDKKNVSQDLGILERMQLVRMRRRGREAFPNATGARITIDLSPSPGAASA